MDSKLQEKLNRIADLENEGYSQELIEAVEDAIENPEAEGDMKFKTMEDFWKWFNSEENK